MGGVFPILMMESSRRRGRLRAVAVLAVDGPPVVAVLVFLAFMATEVI